MLSPTDRRQSSFHQNLPYYYSLHSHPELFWVPIFLLLLFYSFPSEFPILYSNPIGCYPMQLRWIMGFHYFCHLCPNQGLSKLQGLLYQSPNWPPCLKSTATISLSGSCSKPGLTLLACPIGFNPTPFHGIQGLLTVQHHPLLYPSRHSINNDGTNDSSPWARALGVLYGPSIVVCSVDNSEGMTVYPPPLLRYC